MSKTDFRTQSARRKRQRMRERLLQATMTVCGGAALGEQAVIDDVIRSAGVSRGTFYKYFASLEEAKGALGQHLTNELVEGIGAMFQEVADPVRRTASGWILIMARAATHPEWGRFVVHSEYFTDDSALLAAVRRNTLAGSEAGAFTIDSVEAAIDFQMGVAREGMRHLIHGPEDAQSYIIALTAMGLRGLGLPKQRAATAARRAMTDIARRAPDHLVWWRPLPCRLTG